jgi:uncharacterized membrane protein
LRAHPSSAQSSTSSGFIDVFSSARLQRVTAAVIHISSAAWSKITLPFSGSLVFPLAVALADWIGRERQVAVLAFLSAAIYGPGVFAVTFLVNVPLNEALANANPTSDTAVSIWANYYGPWTAWNHVRAVCACLAFGLFAAAAVVHFRRPSSGWAASTSSRIERP